MTINRNLSLLTPNVSASGAVNNAGLTNSSVTIGSTAVSLGATVTTFAGLTSVTSTSFVGALTGNASTSTTLQTARTINGVSFDGSANITVADSTKLALTGGTLTGALTINAPSEGTWTKPIAALVPTLGNSQNAQFTFGKALSNNNLVEYSYHHQTDGSASNFFTMGFYGGTNRVAIRTDGRVSIGNPYTSPTFTYELNVNGTASATTFNGALTGNASTATSAATWTTPRNLAGNSVDGSAAVAFANKFIVQGTTDTGLTGAQFLGALGTGVIKNTTTTGVLSIAVAGDFPTLNQNTTGSAGSAATLTTTRAIYGNNFDGSAALTQIIASTYGGTGNGFTKFTGATTAEKTYTLPDASSTIVVQGGALGTPSSGTVTNLTGTASININGTVGDTTANTGAFTTLSATGVTTVQTGTAALPAITTTGDTDTGIYFPAADTIAFTEGGVESVRINASGNMGIGTASPDSSNKLEVAGDISLSWNTNKFIGMKYLAGASYKMGLMLNDGTRECKVWSQSSESDDKITFYTGSTPSERMRITSAGGVSFGSTGTAYGTSGQVLTSAGNASPTWTTPAGGSGGITTGKAIAMAIVFGG